MHVPQLTIDQSQGGAVAVGLGAVLRHIEGGGDVPVHDHDGVLRYPDILNLDLLETRNIIKLLLTLVIKQTASSLSNLDTESQGYCLFDQLLVLITYLVICKSCVT